MSAGPSRRELVIAALLQDRNRAWTAARVTQQLALHGYRLDPRAVHGELERLYREGSARRGRDGDARAYQLVAIPQKAPNPIARLNHIRKTWKQADSCTRKTVALRALRDEFKELSAQPVRNRPASEQPEARRRRNQRYRSELNNKARATRTACQRNDL